MSDCRDGTVLCKLGMLGGSSIQISGQSAANIERSHQDERKSTAPLAPLAPGQYDLMIIGDMPSSEDDKLDMAWQDSSGETIVRYLKVAGFDLTRVWMTRVAKCKPNVRKRKPTVKEFKTCRDAYLLNELKAILPKVIMLVGSPTLKAFNLTGKGSLNAIHGKVFEAQFPGWEESPTFNVIPTLNPSTFFYNPNPKLSARVGHDYVVAKELIQGQTPAGHFIPDWHLIDTTDKLMWLKDKLLSTPLFGWDTESCHLGFRKAPQLCFSFAWGWEPDQCATLPILQHDPEAPQEQTYHTKPGFGALNEKLVSQFIKDVFLTPSIAKAAHNFKYDLNVLRWNYGIVPQGLLLDTLTMKHQMDETPPSDLEFLCDCEFSWGDYSAEKRKITGTGKKLKATYDKVPDALLWPYAAADALGTYRLCALYLERLQARPNLWKFHLEESEPLVKALAKAEWKGALIDLNVLEELKKQYLSTQRELKTKMRVVTWPDFNPMSTPQALKAFLNLGVSNVDLEEKSAASGYTTNKQKLTDIIESGQQPQADFASHLLSFRNLNKMITTYLENVKEDIDKDGRVRYSWTMAGPVTGRLACKLFHQVPKINETIACDSKGGYIPFSERMKKKKVVMRDMFTAANGCKYVYGDYSQVELWILAILAEDVEMLRVLNGGGDLHSATAYEFLSPVWPGLKEDMISKFNRAEVGKRINFGLAYGSEGYALVKTGKWKDENDVERNFTWDMLNLGMARWKNRFQGVGRFIDITSDLVRGYGGTATNVFGRERHYGSALNAADDYKRAAAERECINFFIQSVAASLTNRTIIEVDRMLERFNIKEDTVCLVNTVHDSVAYEVKDSHVDWFLAALEAISLRAIPELGDTQFKIDCGIGTNWTEAEMMA